MKAFIISLSIVLVIFALTVINSIYVHNTTNKLIEEAQNLKVENDSVEQFYKLWEETQFAIRLSSSHDETHKIDEVLGVLSAKAKEGDPSGFCEERALLVEYLKQIQEDEKISLDSII